MDKKLRDLTDALNAAEEAQIERLKELYPRGMRVAVLLNANQKLPTHGQVRYHSSGRFGGHVGVYIDNQKPRSRFRVRAIAPNNIVWTGDVMEVPA